MTNCNIEYMQEIAIIMLKNFVKGGMLMRFVDYKCSDCQSISEIVIMSDNGCEITCEKCGSSNMVRIFAPVGFKSSSSSSGSGDFSTGSQSSSRSCSGTSCSTCSGCG